ncbi:MAG: hypothetical protein RL277_1693 [Planctomycetota bacterium]
MNSVRLWVLLLALVSFGAGLAAGVFWTTQRMRPEPAAGPFDQYRADLVREFRLSPEREKHLGKILAAYEQEIVQIKDRFQATTMAQMEPELAERGRYYRSVIQNQLLPPGERERFQQMASGLPTTPN